MVIFETAFLILTAGFIILCLSCLLHEKRASISPTPVLPWVRKKAIAMIAENKAETNKNYRIADLGSGWGGMLLKLARIYPNSKITGYEISPWPRWISKLRSLFHKNITLRNEDFFEYKMNEFDILFCYLSPTHMEKLAEKFDHLPAGKIIISASFAIPGWTPQKTEITRGFVDIPVYLYKT